MSMTTTLCDPAETMESDFERYRRELHVHCYRMLGSFEDAEDAVQETLLKAWRSRATFSGDGQRAWLYRIATNVCLDGLRRSGRRPATVSSFADVPWLQPYPDRLLDELSPEAVVVARETIELAFIAAIQLLAPRQRAVLILREVLDWSAAETADLLDTSPSAVNSALQRARATLRDQLPAHTGTTTELSETERAVLAAYVSAHERCDVDALVAVTARDVRITMPPQPLCYQGIDSLTPLVEVAFGPNRMGDWHVVPTTANRLPAAACYLRRPGETTWIAFKLDVLRVVDGRIAETTTFDHTLFDRFGLPGMI
jgi:RNA polymerase sigma-70 factor (TIGR02960 family)